MTTKDFYELSAALTGVDALPEAHCESYLTRLTDEPAYAGLLDSVLQLYRTNGKDLILKADPDQLKCCRGIVFLWYTSELVPFAGMDKDAVPNERTPGSQEEYYGSLIWKVVRAHPPGLTGGYYGHWKYEPEN